jgi:transcriptional regulator with XRE-family HTH domain
MELSTMTSFGERLEIFRKHTGLGQKEFAKKFGSDQASISHWENNRNVPDLPTAIGLLKAYPELNIFWLVDGEGEMLRTNHSNTDEKYKKIAETWKQKYIDEIEGRDKV